MSYEGSLTAQQYAACSFSVAQEYAQDYLREATFGSERAIVTMGPFRRPIRFRFGVRSDRTDFGRANEEIVLHWIAGTRWLPDFDGTLRMRAAMPGTKLILDGRYRPPGGRLGALFDRVLGRRIAHASASSLLTRVAEALTQRETAWRAAARASSLAAFASESTSS